MRKSVVSIACVALISAWSSAADKKPPLRLVTGDDYAPLSAKSSLGGGVFTTLVTAVLKEAGLSMTLARLEWTKAESGTQKGEYLAAFPYMKTDERARAFAFTDPVMVVKNVYISRKSGQPFKPEGGILCKPEGYGVEAELEALLKSGKLTLQMPKPKDLHECLRMIKDGKSGFAATTELIAREKLAADYGREPPFTVTPAGTELPLYVIVSTAKPLEAKAFLKSFNQALAAMNKRGETTAIVDRYFATKP